MLCLRQAPWPLRSCRRGSASLGQLENSHVSLFKDVSKEVRENDWTLSSFRMVGGGSCGGSAQSVSTCAAGPYSTGSSQRNKGPPLQVPCYEARPVAGEELCWVSSLLACPADLGFTTPPQSCEIVPEISLSLICVHSFHPLVLFLWTTLPGKFGIPAVRVPTLGAHFIFSFHHDTHHGISWVSQWGYEFLDGKWGTGCDEP